ncbi:GNAT family N-acetyltransferase [Streptomyces sp. NPDC017993]|uniref:GNAT family N-acetyltransferase n=1 Tax=Streptomyces sp. NPDC017993 TaxID=3365027 RepID=UPI0037B42515
MDSCDGRDARAGRHDAGAAPTLRRLTADDSVPEITALLHRAYADHAAAGRVFFASYQSDRDTRYRLDRGESWVAVEDGRIVGTVTLTGNHHSPPGYPVPHGHGSLWQLAVEPDRRGTGLGDRLLAHAERRIAALGASRVVFDTSSLATELIAWYERRGYRPAGTYDRSVTNYRSVVLAKAL